MEDHTWGLSQEELNWLGQLRSQVYEVSATITVLLSKKDSDWTKEEVEQMLIDDFITAKQAFNNWENSK